MIHNLNNFVNEFLGSFFVLPARISPKENSGANGKFLPKPLLFHLRHPNSKTNQPKFWQTLSSSKNSFAKTSSAVFRHLPEYLEGRTPKEKHPFLFQKKFHPRQIKKARNVFLSGFPPSPRGGSGGTLRAYNSVSSHHARGVCEVSPFPDSAQNAFGFHRTEGAR